MTLERCESCEAATNERCEGASNQRCKAATNKRCEVASHKRRRDSADSARSQGTRTIGPPRYHQKGSCDQRVVIEREMFVSFPNSLIELQASNIEIWAQTSEQLRVFKLFDRDTRHGRHF